MIKLFEEFLNEYNTDFSIGTQPNTKDYKKALDLFKDNNFVDYENTGNRFTATDKDAYKKMCEILDKEKIQYSFNKSDAKFK